MIGKAEPRPIPPVPVLPSAGMERRAYGTRARTRWFDLASKKQISRLEILRDEDTASSSSTNPARPPLIWELSAPRLHRLCAYNLEHSGSAALYWHRQLTDARQRLRNWVSASGTRLDRGRPTHYRPSTVRVWVSEQDVGDG